MHSRLGHTGLIGQLALAPAVRLTGDADHLAGVKVWHGSDKVILNETPAQGNSGNLNHRGAETWNLPQIEDIASVEVPTVRT